MENTHEAVQGNSRLGIVGVDRIVYKDSENMME